VTILLFYGRLSVKAHWYPLFLDRYEKRHKNLAAHVSPAFRVELGDMVTVGQSQTTGTNLIWPSETEISVGYRSVSTTIENGPLQRAAGSKEQGGDEDIWEVLDVQDGILCRIPDMSYVVDYDGVYSKLWFANDVLRTECESLIGPSNEFT
jgi:hypothetical protein